MKTLPEAFRDLREKIINDARTRLEVLARENGIRLALEQDHPDVLALGPDIYLPRMTDYSLAPGKVLIRLDSASETDGQPIVYLPGFKHEQDGGKLSISFVANLKTGADAEEEYNKQKALLNSSHSA